MALGDKPTTLPEWASGAGADVTEPSGSKKQTGWTDTEKPAHQFFNWLLETTYEWLAWLEQHVHDGTDLPKIDLGDHVDYGTGGQLEVTKDDGVEHVIEHTSNGALLEFKTTILRSAKWFSTIASGQAVGIGNGALNLVTDTASLVRWQIEHILAGRAVLEVDELDAENAPAVVAKITGGATPSLRAFSIGVTEVEYASDTTYVRLEDPPALSGGSLNAEYVWIPAVTDVTQTAELIVDAADVVYDFGDGDEHAVRLVIKDNGGTMTTAPLKLIGFGPF